MRPNTFLHASCPARLSRLPLDSPHKSNTKSVAIRRLFTLAMVLLLLLGQEQLLAQQSQGQGSSQNDPYNGQYAPSQQSDDGQQPYAQQPDPASGQGYPQQGNGRAQPLSAEQLEQLVAPIALYPDTLMAQVLAASTYPAQVADADHWRQAQGYASPEQIAAGADAQAWDPSVKALTAFPQVLAQMDRNLQWTTDLGNAYYNQPQDLLQAVQVMRQRAQAAGNLQSTPQEAVTYDQGRIELAPVNPQMVYVPAYNPWAVYGQPVSPYPGFSLLGALGSFFGSSPVSFGLGIAMTAFSHVGWGWLAWGLSWLTQSVLFNHANYYSQSSSVADWGFAHGGPRAFPGRGAIAGIPNSYGRPGGGYRAPFGHGFVPRPPSSYEPPSRGYNPTLGRGFVPRTSGSYGRPGGAYNPSLAQGFIPRPPSSYAGARLGEGYSRGYQTPSTAYGSRSGAVRGSAPQSYRPPTAGFQRGDFGNRSSMSYDGRGFAQSPGKQAHSGGFHLFGGGHGSENFHGGARAPKSYSGGKSFSSRHSGGGGGHSSGHSSGRHHH
jgi:hypothetical protein